MKTEPEIRAKLAAVQAEIAKGPDNPLQESMWQSLLGFEGALAWVLDDKEKPT